jgi:hypothetical protein
MPRILWTPFEPLLREALEARGGQDASPTDVLKYLQARWPEDAFELTYSKLNPKVWAMKKKLADNTDAGGVTTTALAAPAAGPEAEAAEASAKTDTASVPASAGQVEALDVADAAAPGGATASPSRKKRRVAPVLAATAAVVFHVAPAEGFDHVLNSVLSWGARPEMCELILALGS